MGALSPLDHERLRQALELAELAIGVSEPNPRVGCVLGGEDGSIFGCGSTQRAGEAHAEVMALRDARRAGRDVRGATAWVTLEPCAHHGRTPPCCDAVIAAGVRRVVVCGIDPHRLVLGAGIARLREAGIEVTLAEGELAERARELNIGFYSRHERGRPWVRLKVAASLDGRTALSDGRSQWITSEQARIDGHRWRKRAGATLTGIGTVLRDDPRLDVRLAETICQPLRVVVDSKLRIPLDAKIIRPPGRTLVVAASDPQGRTSAVEAAGASVEFLPGVDGGLVDLQSLLALLSTRDVNELHVEAGSRLNGTLLEGQMVDELLIYIAPRLIGAGLPIAALGDLRAIVDSVSLRFTEVSLLGPDLRLLARPFARSGPAQLVG